MYTKGIFLEKVCDRLRNRLQQVHAERLFIRTTLNDANDLYHAAQLGIDVQITEGVKDIDMEPYDGLMDESLGAMVSEALKGRELGDKASREAAVTPNFAVVKRYIYNIRPLDLRNGCNDAFWKVWCTLR